MTASRREAEGTQAPRFSELSRRQRLLLTGVVLLLPFALAGLFEAGLRLADYGGDYPLFVPYESDPAYLVPNPEVGRRYFLDALDAPRPHADLLLREKGPGTYRIVVQGASSAAGFPYYFGGSFSRMLRERLQRTFPDRRIEVVNVALDATNSYAIHDLVDEIVAVDPDAVLIYAGHNEFYGTFGVASAQSLGRNPSVVRAYLGVRDLRIVQLLRAAIGRARAAVRGGGPGEGGSATLMERLSRDRTVRADSPLRDAALRQLGSNLDRILAAYADAGISVLIGTPASNERDLPPFVSRPALGVDSAAWDADVHAAAEALAAGNPSAARVAVDDLIARDSLAPLPWHLRARALEAGGDSAAAREAFYRARDWDQLPFRAPRAVEEAIRASARRHGATVVESRERLAEVSPHGVIGAGIMLEHVHPRVEGQLLIADAFYEALRERGEIGAWDRWVPLDSARTRIPVTAVDTLAGALWIERLTAGFPFRSTGDGTPVTRGDTVQPTDRIESIAVAMYRDDLPWPEAQRLLYEHYIAAGLWDEAEHVAHVLGHELPLWEGAWLMAGRAARLAGRVADALEAFRRADSLRPTLYGARNIGGLLASGGDTAAARPYFERVVQLAGDDREGRLALRAFDAIPELEAASAADPRNADVLADLSGTYLITAQFERAEETARRALEIDPDNEEAAGILDRVVRSRTPTGPVGDGS